MLSDTTGLPIILEKCFAAIESEGKQQKNMYCSLVDLIRCIVLASTSVYSGTIVQTGRY